MLELIIAVICLGAGVFGGYNIGMAPGTTFIEKAKSYFTGGSAPPPSPPTGTAV